LIALALMTVLFVGVASFTAHVAGGNARARAATLATIAAVELIERLQALPLDDPALASSPPGTLTGDVAGYFDAPIVGFTRRWSVEPLPSLPGAGPGTGIVLRVVVTHRAGSGDARLVAVKTHVRR